MRNLSSGTELVHVYRCDVCGREEEWLDEEYDIPPVCRRDYIAMDSAKAPDGHKYSLIRHEDHGPMAFVGSRRYEVNPFADERSAKYDREAAHALAAVAKIEAMVRGEDVVG